MFSAALLSLLPVASAASFDPRFQWATVDTEHFAITFHQGEEQIAAEMVQEAEAAWATQTAEIGTTPKGKVQLVLMDPTDSANGYATVVPNKQIVIFVTAPQEDSVLDDYEDWGRIIVTHELTHVLHLDTVHGLPLLGRWIFGSIVSTNLVAPGWVTEGYATFEETRQSTGGRGHSAFVDMIKRTAWLDGRFPKLDTLDGYQSLPPGGNLRYVFGQDFIQFIADRSGAQKWSEWVQRYGASIPFFLRGKAVFGASLYKLHDEWVAEVSRRYQAQVDAVTAEGLTSSTLLTSEKLGCGSPSWSPQGLLAWVCSDPRRGSSIWIDDGTGKKAKILLKGHAPKNLMWRSDGKALVFAELHSVDIYNSYEDLYTYELPSKQLKQVTRGARTHDPSYSPDGSRLLAVTNELRNNNLAVLTVDGKLTPLTDFQDHSSIGTPRYSPDGSQIAMSLRSGSMRDIWLFTADGKPLRRLTWDSALDRDPAWSADGKYLYFTSDRSGIPNIYAIEMASDQLYRVTNVVTGAYDPSPSPDGKQLAYTEFVTMGGRVAVMPLEPSSWKKLGKLPWFPPGTMPGDANGQARPDLATPEKEIPYDPLAESKKSKREPWDYPETVAGLPVHRYNPWPLAFPPRYWIPSGFLTTTGDSLGLLGYAATGGSDPLRQIAYSAYLSYRTDAQFFGGGASLLVNRWRPVFGASGSSYVVPYGSVYLNSPTSEGPNLPGIESARERYWDHRVRFSLSSSYPLDSHSSVGASYQGTFRTPLDPLPEGVYYPNLPTRGFFSSIGVGWSYSNGSSYSLSISPEKARVLSAGAEYSASWLGSYTFDDEGKQTPFDQLQLSAQWREYRTVPGLPNHVLAFKLAGGATIGDHFRYGSFRLGGSYSENGVTIVPEEFRSLRGFYYGADSGEWYWLGSGEYRFPILHVDRGFGALPLFIQSVSGTLLVDAGNAFDDVEGAALSNTLVGVGGELNVSMVVGWGGGVDARLGYAFSPYGGGIALGDLGGGYLELGSSF